MTRLSVKNYPNSLTGSAGNVTATNNALDLQNGGTFAAWMKFYKNGSGHTIALIQDLATLNYVRINQDINTGKLFTFVVQNNVGALGCKTPESVPTNKWVHVVFTYDGAGSTTIYIDGVAKATGNSGKIPEAATVKLTVYPSSNGVHPMTDVRFWSRALSSTEVSNLYFSGLNPNTVALWWKMDEGTGSTVADSSGNGITGTITSQTWQTDSPMTSRQTTKEMMAGLSFDGSTSKVSLSKTVPVTTGITYSAWVNPSTIKDQRILGLNNNSSIRLGSDGKVYFVLFGIVEHSTSTIIKKGTWTHVAATYDKQNFKIYINGVLDRQVAVTNSFPASGTLIEVGSYTGTPQFNGKIDDCKIWVDRVLTPTEISNLYYKNSYTKDKMLVEYFLNEGISTTAIDTSGNGNNGTITAGAYILDVPQRSRLLNRPEMKTSLSFAGAGYVQLPAIPTTAGLSISAWIKTPTPVPATGMDIMGRSAGTSDLLELNTSGQLRFNFMTSLGPNSLLSATNILTKNKWHHVIGTYDLATATNKLYLDGVIVGSYTVVAGTISNNANTWMLGALTTVTRNWVGNIADVKMFDGALTPSQVFELYLKNKLPTNLPLVAQYLLNEGAGLPIDTANRLYSATSISAATYVKDTPFYKRQEVNPNLVNNGDFSYTPPFTAATTASGFFIDGTASGSSTNSLFGWALQFAGTMSAQFDTTNLYKGKPSLKVSATSTGTNAEVGVLPTNTAANVRNFSARLIPGTSYTASFYMKTNYISGDSAGGARMEFVERDAAGTAVVTNATTSVKTTTDWTLYTLTFTANATQTYLCPRMRVQGNTGTATLIMDAWFADIVIKPTTAVVRQNA